MSGAYNNVTVIRPAAELPEAGTLAAGTLAVVTRVIPTTPSEAMHVLTANL